MTSKSGNTPNLLYKDNIIVADNKGKLKTNIFMKVL